MVRRKSLPTQVVEQLRQRIAAGAYKGSEIPPERVLMEEFSVSRYTLRIALQRLVDDGLIERRAGLGTRVTKRATGGVWTIGRLEDLIGEFSVDQYLTISAEREAAQRFPTAATLFNCAPDDNIFHVLRFLTINDLPYAVANIFAPVAYTEAIPASEFGSKALIHLVEQYSGVRAERARQMASAVAADTLTARQLGVPVGSPMLLLHRTYLMRNDQPIVHSEVLCRPDRYQQVVEFEHERKPRGAGDITGHEDEAGAAGT